MSNKLGSDLMVEVLVAPSKQRVYRITRDSANPITDSTSKARRRFYTSSFIWDNGDSMEFKQNSF